MKLKLEGLGFLMHLLRLFEGRKKKKKRACLQLQKTSKSVSLSFCLVLNKGHCACAWLCLLGAYLVAVCVSL